MRILITLLIAVLFVPAVDASALSKFEKMKAAQVVRPPIPPLPPFFPISLQAGDRIVIAGDSITAGATNPGGFLIVMNQWIQSRYAGQNITLAASGVPGNKAADLAARLQRDVLSQQPTIIIIFIGINDVPQLNAGAGGYSPDLYQVGDIPETELQFVNIMNSMITQCKNCPSVRAVILSTAECYGEKFNGENYYDAPLNALWALQIGIAQANQIPVIDLRQAYLYEDYTLNYSDAASGVLTIDGIHPNAPGSEYIAACFLIGLGI